MAMKTVVIIACFICWKSGPIDAAASAAAAAAVVPPSAGYEASSSSSSSAIVLQHQQRRRRRLLLRRNHRYGRGNTNNNLSLVAFQYQHGHNSCHRQLLHQRRGLQHAGANNHHHREQLSFTSSLHPGQQDRRRQLQQNAILNESINCNDSNDNDDHTITSTNLQLCQQTLDLALSKFAIISHPTFASKFNKHRISNVTVRKSNIANAGLGLFATKNIKKGMIISFYPVDCIGIEDVESSGGGGGEDGGDGEELTTIVRWRRNRKLLSEELLQEQEQNEIARAIKTWPEKDCMSTSSRNNDQAYLLHIVGNRPLMKMDIMNDLGGSSIFINVDVNDDPTSQNSGDDSNTVAEDGESSSIFSSSSSLSGGFDSHRVNDGATVLSNTEHGALTYYQSSRSAANCVHVPFGPSPLLATVTTRKVKKGEELLTTYGCSLDWLNSLLKDTGEEETEMTESIIFEAKQVALDIFKGMKEVSVTYASEAEVLQAVFDAP
ncbi:hypothetical protein ACHAWU_007803 [Discostella pseudostelligera]|uniref:SET domain-containing protein n=1 Tax=Discostella pseudostelligera TaxID=259834 RepID=A0ABD3MCX2_9STRA